jgi:hypothetical protein
VTLPARSLNYINQKKAGNLGNHGNKRNHGNISYCRNQGKYGKEKIDDNIIKHGKQDAMGTKRIHVRTLLNLNSKNFLNV